MGKLTYRSPDLTEGFRSEFTKPEVVRKLGFIEHRGPELLGAVCDYGCRFPMEADDDELQGICDACPVTKLMGFVE